MSKHWKAVAVPTCFAILALQAIVLVAQTPKTTPPAPVPRQILAAKKVFVVNAGGDELFDDPKFGGVDRTYNQFYAAMKAWGRYELVETPAARTCSLRYSSRLVQLSSRSTVETV